MLELARLLREAGFDDVADKLENGYHVETKVLALTIADREAVLRALDDPPPTTWAEACSCAGTRGAGACARAWCNRCGDKSFAMQRLGISRSWARRPS